MTNSADENSADEKPRGSSNEERASGSNSRKTGAKRWKIRYRGATDAGTARLVNEDSFRIIRGRFWKLFLVADGIGGPTKGGVASELALETIEKELVDETTLSNELLSKALAQANTKVFERGMSSPLLKGMATTISGLALQDDTIFIVNIGNSRVYRVRDKEIKQLTTDHTLAAELQALGSYDESVEKTRKASHLLTRSLGSAPTVDVYFEAVSGDIQREDVLLVSSDGLTDSVRGPDLVKKLSGGWSDEIAQDLVDLANERGGTDNITAIVIRFDREVSPSQAELGDEVSSPLESQSGEASAEEEEEGETRKEARPTGAFRLAGGGRRGRARSKTFSGVPPQAEAVANGETESPAKEQDVSRPKSAQPNVVQESAIPTPLDEEAKRIEQLIREAFGLGPVSSTSSEGDANKAKEWGEGLRVAEPDDKQQGRAATPGRKDEREAKGASVREDDAKEADLEDRTTAARGRKAGESATMQESVDGSGGDTRSRGGSKGKEAPVEVEEDEVEFAEGEDVVVDEDEAHYSDQEDGYLDEEDEEWYDDEQEEEYTPRAPSLPSRFAIWLVVGFFVGAGIALLYPYVGGKSGSDSKVRLARQDLSKEGERPGYQEPSGVSKKRGVVAEPGEQEIREREIDSEPEIRALEDPDGFLRKQEAAGSRTEVSAQFATMSQPQLVPMEKIAGVVNPALRLMISDVLSAIRSTLGSTSRRLDMMAEQQSVINEKLDELAKEVRVIESKLQEFQSESPQPSSVEEGDNTAAE